MGLQQALLVGTDERQSNSLQACMSCGLMPQVRPQCFHFYECSDTCQMQLVSKQELTARAARR